MWYSLLLYFQVEWSSRCWKLKWILHLFKFILDCQDCFKSKSIWIIKALFDHFILTAFALDPLLLHSLLFLLLVKYSIFLFIDLAAGLDHTKNNKYFTCWSFKVDLVLSRKYCFIVDSFGPNLLISNSWCWLLGATKMIQQCI